MAVYLSRGVEWCSLTGGVCLVFGGQGVRGTFKAAFSYTPTVGKHFLYHWRFMGNLYC